MFKVGQKVIYKQDVCTVKNISKNKFTNLDSYTLSPLFDDSLTIIVPIENKNNYLKPLLTKEEVENLINKIPSIKAIKTEAHNMETEYRNLFHTGKHEDLIKIIKTTYSRNEERINNNRNVGEKDKEYFNKAEKYLYNELSIVLNKSFEETKKYVIDKVNQAK